MLVFPRVPCRRSGFSLPLERATRKVYHTPPERASRPRDFAGSVRADLCAAICPHAVGLSAVRKRTPSAPVERSRRRLSACQFERVPEAVSVRTPSACPPVGLSAPVTFPPFSACFRLFSPKKSSAHIRPPAFRLFPPILAISRLFSPVGLSAPICRHAVRRKCRARARGDRPRLSAVSGSEAHAVGLSAPEAFDRVPVATVRRDLSARRPRRVPRPASSLPAVRKRYKIGVRSSIIRPLSSLFPYNNGAQKIIMRGLVCACPFLSANRARTR